MTEAEWFNSALPASMLLFATENPDRQGVTCCRGERKLQLLAQAWESPLCGRERWTLVFVPGLDGRIANPCLAIELNIQTRFKPTAAAILRDVVGNPFSPPWPVAAQYYAWLRRSHPAIERLAGSAHDERLADATLDPVTLAILSDALEDAGCDHESLLRHLRGQQPCWACLQAASLHGVGIKCNAECPGWQPLRGPHVRGCWALDLILGKE